jgi:hypothetical protein
MTVGGEIKELEADGGAVWSGNPNEGKGRAKSVAIGQAPQELK